MKPSAHPSRDSPGVVVPPPLIFAGALVAGILIDRVITGWSIAVDATLRYPLAVLPIGAGAALIAAALGLFRKASTRPEPWRPATTLVTEGLYRFTRNPMYLGMAVLYVGLALVLDSPVAFLLLVPVVSVIHCGVIAREERYLAQRFGDTYRRYKAKVRPWL